MQLFFSVGEPSGDHHAAELIRALSKIDSDIEYSGYGGPQMRDAGARIDFELTNLSVMGVGAVIPLLGRFTRLYRETVRLFRKRRPDAVVLVDFPGFNWWVAKAARRASIPVIYYMPPQLWAWASWRIRKVRRLVDLVLSPLPFETEWYRERGVETRFVGHPFLEKPDTDDIDDDGFHLEGVVGRRILILPGSRTQEVTRNFPVMLRVMKNLTARHADVQFHVACHKSSQRRLCESMIRSSHERLPVTLHVGRTPEAIASCDMALTVSGSVSLELLKKTVPTVVLYKCGFMTAVLGVVLAKCKYITLPNLIAEREVMPEFLFLRRDGRHAEGMARVLGNWLESPERLNMARGELQAIRDALRHTSTANASVQAAGEVIEFILRHKNHPTVSDLAATQQRAA